MTEKLENNFKQLQILQVCYCPCSSAQDLVLPSVPFLVLESLYRVWSKTGINSGFRRQRRGGAGRGLCLFQLILTGLYQLLIESLPDDFSCLLSQLLECGRECCQINWC